jgi:hypothetical protein
MVSHRRKNFRAAKIRHSKRLHMRQYMRQFRSPRTEAEQSALIW